MVKNITRFYIFLAIFYIFVNLYFTRINKLIIKRDDVKIERVKSSTEVAHEVYKELEIAILRRDEVYNR